MTTIEEQQSIILNNVFQNYDFGPYIQVESSSGWSFDPAENTHVKPVFYYEESDDPDEETTTSLKCYLTVKFLPNTIEVIDVYAIDQKGHIFGSWE